MPLMRWEELRTGVRVTDREGNKLGDERSKVISSVIVLKQHL